MTRNAEGIAQETLDRLVDGAVDPGELEDVLRRLEAEPGGWRRCALAFLEAAAWRRELAAWSAGAEDPAPATRTAGPLGARPGSWKVPLALAATFLVALALGTGWGFYLRPGPPGGQPRPLAGGGDRSLEAWSDPVARTPSATPERVRPEPPLEPEGRVRLAVGAPAGGPSPAVEIPVYRWSPGRDWMLTPRGPRVPAEVQAVLHRAGRELRHECELVPLSTQDGRRIVVPIERIELLPHDGRIYQ